MIRDRTVRVNNPFIRVVRNSLFYTPIFSILSSQSSAQHFCQLQNIEFGPDARVSALLHFKKQQMMSPDFNRSVLDLSSVDVASGYFSDLLSKYTNSVAKPSSWWSSPIDLFLHSGSRTAPESFVSPISHAMIEKNKKNKKISPPHSQASSRPGVEAGQTCEHKKTTHYRDPKTESEVDHRLIVSRLVGYPVIAVKCYPERRGRVPTLYVDHECNCDARGIGNFPDGVEEPQTFRPIDGLSAMHDILDALVYLYASHFSEQTPDFVLFYQSALRHRDAIVDYPTLAPAPLEGHVLFSEDEQPTRPKYETAYLAEKFSNLPSSLKSASKAGWDSVLSWLHKNMSKENERGISWALTYLFPATEKAIAERQRWNPKNMAHMLVQAQRSATYLADRFRDITPYLRGFTFYSLACQLMYSYSNKDCHQILMTQLRNGAASAGMLAFEKCMKSLHALARRSQVVPSDSVPATVPSSHVRPYATSFFYLNVLIGRFYHAPLADDGSVEDREKYLGEHVDTGADGLPSESLYKQHFDEELAKIIKPGANALATSPIRSESDWMLRFLSYGASGSASRQGKIETGQDRSVSKAFWLATRNAPQVFSKIYTSEATNFNSSITKREAGKIRLLLASNLDAWLIESIVLNEIESTILRSLDEVPLELAAPEEGKRVLERFKQVAELDRWGIVDADYADFNITHTLADFAKYFEELAKQAYEHIPAGLMFEGVEKRLMYHDAALWCRDALTSLWIKNSAQKGSDFKLLNRGLWSGWRSTQFFNTTMNVLYARIARRSCRSQFGEEMLLSSENVGDDSHAVAKGTGASLAFVSALCDQGHELNPAKQIVAGRTSEFLRVTYYASGVAAGALCRSIAGFVGSDLQRPVNRAGRDYTAGCWSAGSGLVRRGFDSHAMRFLLECLNNYWGLAISSEGKKAHAPRAVMFAPTSSGGWGLGLPGDAIKLSKVRFPPHPLFSPAELWEERPEMGAVDNFVSSFANFCHSHKFRLAKPDMIRDALVNAVTTNQNYDFLPKSVYEYFNDLTYNHFVELQEFVADMRSRGIGMGYEIPHSPHPSNQAFIDECLDNFFDPEYPFDSTPEDYAEVIRAGALGLFSAANTKAFSAIKPFDVGQMIDVAKLISLIKGDRQDAIVTALMRHIPIGLFIPLLSYKFHVPGDPHGLIPSELRGRLAHVQSRVLQRMSLVAPSSHEFYSEPASILNPNTPGLATFYTYSQTQLDALHHELVAVTNAFCVGYQQRKYHTRCLW
uniref:RNA-directed RNA polymerase n=1 Tax=Rhizoctonia cerealis megabirnavirus-like virus TaxID=3068669 RepID=A0AA51GGU7_9VIRU|nr:MAG: RNA-dependent RNA polymerase [Rhizoctonia cerealis megabirnavirus-like virus]